MSLFPRYNLVDIKVDRAYYIYVTAPGGYLLSGGVCNDNVPGWECTYKTMGVSRMLRGNGADVDSAVALRRSLDGAKARPPPGAYTPPSEAELELGIYEGRSEKCVRVDRFGMPESHLDLGVMRIGDLAFEDTDVELSLDLIEPEIDGLQRGRRSLLDVIRERILQQDSVEGQDNDGSFVLLQKDKEAIGIVAAEGEDLFAYHLHVHSGLQPLADITHIASLLYAHCLRRKSSPAHWTKASRRRMPFSIQSLPSMSSTLHPSP